MARRDAYFSSFPPCVACQHTQIQTKSGRLYPNSNPDPDPNPNPDPKVAVPNEEWETIWKINVMAHVWVARHLFPLMQENGGGKFVITASAAGQ